MRDDDQIEELKIISRRIFVQASLRSLLKYIHEMRRSSLRVSSIDEYLSINFKSMILDQRKKKKAKFDKENERETHELKSESKQDSDDREKKYQYNSS